MRKATQQLGGLTGFGAPTALHVAIPVAVRKAAARAEGASVAVWVAIRLGFSSEATRLPERDVVGTGDPLVSPRHIGDEGPQTGWCRETDVE